MEVQTITTVTKQQVLSAFYMVMNGILNDEYNFSGKRILEAVDAYIQMGDTPDATEIDLATVPWNTALRDAVSAAAEVSNSGLPFESEVSSKEGNLDGSRP
jgi:hypothetical protein